MIEFFFCRNKISVVLLIGFLVLFVILVISLLFIIFVGIKLKKIKFNILCRNKRSFKGNMFIWLLFYNLEMKNYNVNIYKISIMYIEILLIDVFEK